MNLFETELCIAGCAILILDGTVATVNTLCEGDLLIGALFGIVTLMFGGFFMILMRKRERIKNNE